MVNFAASSTEENIIQQAAKNNSFLYIDIFGGNTPKRLIKSRELKNRLEAHPSRRPLVYLAEMDVCWAKKGEEYILYSYHPSRREYRRPASLQTIVEKEKNGECHFVDDLLREAQDINFFFDLKTGEGDCSVALCTLLSLLGKKTKNCIFYSYDPLMIELLTTRDSSLALSVRTMKQWQSGRSVLVPRASELGTFVNVYDLPVSAITINSKLHRLGELERLNRLVRERGKHLLFGTLGRNVKKFRLAYEIGLGANMNHLSYEDVKEFL